MAGFALGAISVTPGARAALAIAGTDLATLLARHQAGDWGEVEAHDRAESEFALASDRAIYAPSSLFRLPGGAEVLIMTAADRSWTGVLLPDEYATREVDASEGYARWAASYAPGHNPLIAVEEPRVAELLASLPVTTALDAGAGTGRHALAIARRGIPVVALDQSPEMLAAVERAAHEEALPVETMVASLAAPLPLADERFDLIICALVLTHIPDLARAIGELARVLRPGGHLLVTDFHPAAVARGWRTDCHLPGTSYLLPNAPHTRDDYLQAFAAAGIAIETALDVPFGAVPKGYFLPEQTRRNAEQPFCLIVLGRKGTAPA
jgi:SAM-dependent methyltransferase